MRPRTKSDVAGKPLPQPTHAPTPAQSQTPKLVAIVDDDPSFLRSVDRLLRSAGYAVVTFDSAAAFLTSIYDIAPGCLVLDVHMPEMTGLELQDRLVKEGFDIPIILLTAYDTPQTRDHSHRPNCLGLLLKPFDKESLLEVIATAFATPPEPDPNNDESPDSFSI